MPKPLTHRWLVLLTIAAACGYEKTSPLPPGTVNPLPSAPSVSFTSPASMQHVPAKFTVTMAASFTGPLDAYVLTLPSGVSLAVPADPTGAVVVDASAVPNGMLALTATISQNGLSSTATLTVVVDRTLLTPILTPLTGFYKLNENVPMGATFPAGSPVHDVNFVTPAGTLPGVIDEATGVWSASVLAMSLGRGDVTISVNAADALGNAGSTTSGTFTIGLLHDTACPTCKGQLQLDVVTPAGEGILYAANIDTTAAGTVSATQNLGDLRFTTFGGGATVTIASRVCFNTSAPSATGEGADVIVSADASRILFTSAPATTTGAPVCSQLMASALPPASGTTTPQQVGIGLTVPLNPGMDVLSSDGTVGVWSPDGTTMVGGAVGQPAIPPVTLTETFMASDVSGRWLPLNGSLLVPAPDGTALYILNEAGLIPLSVGSGPSAVAVTTSTISTNYWSKTGVPSADGSAALVLGGDEKTLYSVNATDGVVTPICTPPACTFSNQSYAAGPVVHIAGGYVVFQALDSNGNPELGYYTGAGAASFVTGGEFPLDTSDYNSGNRPRDGSGLPILVPPASGVVGRSDVVFLSPPSPTASPGPYTTQVLASNLDTDGANVNFVQYESNWWWGDAPYLFRSFFNRFDDSDHCFVFDDRGLFFDKVGASPVAIGAGSPERFAGLDEDNGPIIFLPGRKTVLIPFNDTGGDYYNPPAGNLWAYTLESGAAVQLVPPSPSTATNVILPVGDDANWSTSAGAAADLLSARHVVFGIVRHPSNAKGSTKGEMNAACFLSFARSDSQSAASEVVPLNAPGTHARSDPTPHTNPCRFQTRYPTAPSRRSAPPSPRYPRPSS